MLVESTCNPICRLKTCQNTSSRILIGRNSINVYQARRLVATPAQAIGSALLKSSSLSPACITFERVKYMVLPSPRPSDSSFIGCTVLITLQLAPLAPGTRQILLHTAPSTVSSTDWPLWKHCAPHLVSAANSTQRPMVLSSASVGIQASSPCL